MEVAFKLPCLCAFQSTPTWRPHLHNCNPKPLLVISPLSLSPISPVPKYYYDDSKAKSSRKWEWLGVAYQYSRGGSSEYSEEEEEEEGNGGFDEAVALFNQREYYKCHDLLEGLWNKAEEPTRTLIHGILQCAVGFHHLFNMNHRGAMMELGEGLCKLRKMNFQSGPFYDFEQDIAAVLHFIYNTQIELAACGDDMCVTMEQSERSYRLLGGYAAGQHLYHLQTDSNQIMYIVFRPHKSHASAPSPSPSPRVRLPILKAAEGHLLVYE